MGKKRLARLLAPLVALGLAATGCGGSGGSGDSAGGTATGGDAQPIRGLQIIVPNSPGSGYDTTARAAAKAMEEAGLARAVEVSNVAGAGGTVGLQRLVNEKGSGETLLQMGLGVVGATYTNKSKATLQETTPIARLVEEAEAIVVPKDSPYRTLQDLLTAWKANPGKVPVGGASAPGGPDHLTPMLLAKAAGPAPKTVNYVAYDGGGELMTALLGAKVAFGATGTGEVAEQAKSGQVRVLAVTSAQRVPEVDAPTLKEAGVNLDFTNWRGIVAAPGITEEDKSKFIGLLDKMHESPEWKAALTQNGWTDAYQSGEQFTAFLQSENDRVRQVLAELGLA
jgi:putative tricarboxylic transport membrane protein